MLICKYFKTYVDRKSISSLQVVLCFYQKKSWWSLRRLEDMSWKTSSGRPLEDVLTTSEIKVVATSISDQSKTSLRPEIRCSYDVFATSLRRLCVAWIHDGITWTCWILLFNHKRIIYPLPQCFRPPNFAGWWLTVRESNP